MGGFPQKKDLENDEPTPTFDYSILGKTTNRFYDVRWLVILKDKIVSTICFLGQTLTYTLYKKNKVLISKKYVFQ